MCVRCCELVRRQWVGRYNPFDTTRHLTLLVSHALRWTWTYKLCRNSPYWSIMVRPCRFVSNSGVLKPAYGGAGKCYISTINSPLQLVVNLLIGKTSPLPITISDFFYYIQSPPAVRTERHAVSPALQNFGSTSAASQPDLRAS